MISCLLHMTESPLRLKQPNASLPYCFLSFLPTWPGAFTLQLIRNALKRQTSPVCRQNSQISPDVKDFHLFHTHTKEKSVISGEEKRIREFRSSRRKVVFTPNDSQNECDSVPGVLRKTNILDLT